MTINFDIDLALLARGAEQPRDHGGQASGPFHGGDMVSEGHVMAQNDLGVMHGVPQNQPRAVTWYRMAADEGNVMYILGIMYTTQWYRMAEGHARAQYNLGCAYATGLGVPQGSSEARFGGSGVHMHKAMGGHHSAGPTTPAAVPPATSPSALAWSRASGPSPGVVAAFSGRCSRTGPLTIELVGLPSS